MVERITKEYDAKVNWKPFLLHPEWLEDGTPLPHPSGERVKVGRERLKQMANDYGLPFVESEVRPNSRRALEASEFAQDQGKNVEFHRRVFNKLFGEGQDIHDWKVLKAVAIESGLDPDVMQREVDSGKYREVLSQKLAEGQAQNITAVPTYIINGKYAIVGAQPYEEFKRIIEQLTD